MVSVFKRRFLSFGLAFAMLFGNAALASAAELESPQMFSSEYTNDLPSDPSGSIAVPFAAQSPNNWYKTTGLGFYVGAFTCYNNNLTPVKTIYESGMLTIHGIADKADNLYGNVVTKIQIREFPSGRVLLYDESFSISDDGTEHMFMTPELYVHAGQQIQIFYDVCSIGTPPGGYRSAYISYYYALE